MPSWSSCAWTAWASLTALAYRPWDVIRLRVKPFGCPALARYCLALVRFCAGHGWSAVFDLYWGDVMGPVTVPAPSAAVSTTPWAEMAHWMASRVFTLDRTGEAALSWSTSYCSAPTLSIVAALEAAVLAA